MKSQSKQNFLQKISPDTGGKKLLMFVLVFALLGGGYYAYRSFAETRYSISGFGGYGCKTTPTLQSGSKGDCVKALQAGLNNEGAFASFTSGGSIKYTPLSVDGDFGPGTKSAVAAYQARKNLKISGKKLSVDGVVGSGTWNQIQNDCAFFLACNFGTGK